MKLDIEYLISEGLITKTADQDIPRFNERKNEFRKYLSERFEQENPNFKGIVYFLSAVTQSGQQAGHAAVYPKNSNSVVIVPSSVQSNHERTFIHECGHVLGLLHPFKDEFEESLKKLINKDNNKIEEYTNDTSGSKIRYKGDLFSKEAYIDVLIKRKKEKEDILLSNFYKFKKTQTDNFMDYYNVANSFNRWQWKIMQKEVKEYHGE